MAVNYLYYTILFIIFLFSGWEILNNLKSSRKSYLFYTIVIILISFCGFRPLFFDKDIQMYFNYFEEFCDYSYHDIFFNNTHRIKEKGYIIINKLFCEIGYRPMVLFFALLGIGIKSQIIYRSSLIPITTLFIYIVTFFPLREFTQIRDAVSSSFVILAFVYFQNKKMLLSVFYFFIALSFHLVALIYIPVILILLTFKKRIYYDYFLIVCGILFFFKPTEWLYGFKGLPVQIIKYKTLKSEGSVLILLFVALVIAFYHITRRFSKIEETAEVSFYVKISYLAIAFGLLTFHHQVMFRLSNVLIFFTILLFTCIATSWKNMKARYLFIGLTFIFYLLGIRNFILINS